MSDNSQNSFGNQYPASYYSNINNLCGTNSYNINNNLNPYDISNNSYITLVPVGPGTNGTGTFTFPYNEQPYGNLFF